MPGQIAKYCQSVGVASTKKEAQRKITEAKLNTAQSLWPTFTPSIRKSGTKWVWGWLVKRFCLIAALLTLAGCHHTEVSPSMRPVEPVYSKPCNPPIAVTPQDFYLLQGFHADWWHFRHDAPPAERMRDRSNMPRCQYR